MACNTFHLIHHLTYLHPSPLTSCSTVAIWVTLSQQLPQVHSYTSFRVKTRTVHSMEQPFSFDVLVRHEGVGIEEWWMGLCEVSRNDEMKRREAEVTMMLLLLFCISHCLSLSKKSCQHRPSGVMMCNDLRQTSLSYTQLRSLHMLHRQFMNKAG